MTEQEREKLIAGDTVEIVAAAVKTSFRIHAFDGCVGRILTEEIRRDRRFLIVGIRAGREGSRSGTVKVPEVALKRSDNGADTT